MMTDPISDLLTRMRNVNLLGRKSVTVPHSRLKEHVLDVIRREGFIDSFEVDRSGRFPQLRVSLKYGPDGEKVIRRMRRVSRPGRRVYKGVDELSPVLQGMGILVLSTSQGVLSDSEARTRRLGGEVLCEIY